MLIHKNILLLLLVHRVHIEFGLISFLSGGATFALAHRSYRSCGIPDGDTYIMTGGDNEDSVTR